MGKIVQNSISYSGASARKYVDLVDTLAPGATTLTLRSACLNRDSTVTIFTSKYGVNPLTAVLGNNSLTLTFAEMEEELQVKVRIWGVEPSQIYADGNNIYYPVASAITSNKLYKESYIQQIALAINSDKPLLISEMADEIKSAISNGGIKAIDLDVKFTNYETVSGGS